MEIGEDLFCRRDADAVKGLVGDMVEPMKFS